jgi:hypothetical protein
MIRPNDLIEKSKVNIPKSEKSNILSFFWLDIYHALVDLNYKDVYIRGLGTFWMRYNKLEGLKNYIRKKVETVQSREDLSPDTKDRMLSELLVYLENIEARKKELRDLKEERIKFNEQKEAIRNISEQGEDLGRSKESSL